MLGGKHGNSGGITCYGQDPVYSDVDRAVLEQSGITILNDPEAFLEVDDSTVVILAHQMCQSGK
jgi:hypothetical protein